MARSTGPILAVGGITLANRHLLAKKPADEIDWRIPVGTAIAAGGLALLERASEGLAVGIAYIALVAVLFARLDPKAGAPAENLLRIWEGK
jgi:thiamine monophosphate synthase